MLTACYTLSKVERQGFCEFLKSVKFPDGYALNISRCVSEGTQPEGPSRHSYRFKKTFLLNPFLKLNPWSKPIYTVMLSIKTLLNMVGNFFLF